MRSSSDSLALLIASISAARLAAYLATVLARFSSRLIRDSFAISPSVLERELECGEQSARLFVRLGSRRDADIHPTQSIDLVVLDFGEDDLFLDAQVVVTTTIKALASDTAEVADTGN